MRTSGHVRMMGAAYGLLPPPRPIHDTTLGRVTATVIDSRLLSLLFPRRGKLRKIEQLLEPDPLLLPGGREYVLGDRVTLEA